MLRQLINAVEAGTATMNEFAAAFPSETAYGPTTWGEAYKAFNGSLDAAKRLHDALLPGWKWGAHEPRPGVFRVYVSKRSVMRPMPTAHEAADPARAWLLSILRAMEGRE